MSKHSCSTSFYPTLTHDDRCLNLFLYFIRVVHLLLLFLDTFVDLVFYTFQIFVAHKTQQRVLVRCLKQMILLPRRAHESDAWLKSEVVWVWRCSCGSALPKVLSLLWNHVSSGIFKVDAGLWQKRSFNLLRCHNVNHVIVPIDWKVSFSVGDRLRKRNLFRYQLSWRFDLINGCDVLTQEDRRAIVFFLVKLYLHTAAGLWWHAGLHLFALLTLLLKSDFAFGSLAIRFLRCEVSLLQCILSLRKILMRYLIQIKDAIVYRGGWRCSCPKVDLGLFVVKHLLPLHLDVRNVWRLFAPSMSTYRSRVRRKSFANFDCLVTGSTSSVATTSRCTALSQSFSLVLIRVLRSKRTSWFLSWR